MESIHPLIVHFPIALLLTAWALEALGLLLRRPTLYLISLWNLCLGTLGAIAAVLSGLQAERVAKHSFEIWQVMERHKQLGFITLALAILLAGWRLVRKDHLNLRARVISFLLLGVLTLSVSFGAYLGGKLVFELGVGTTSGQ